MATRTNQKNIFRNNSGDRRPLSGDLLAAPVKRFARLFACWHRDMSRPFTRASETYRVCLSCGAYRRFDTERWRMCGSYYYSPAQPLRKGATEDHAGRAA